MATILVADDSPTSRQLLISVLRYGGHRPLEASDGSMALDLARSEHPDLAIVDVLMPTMDGYQFVQQLRTDPSYATLPVVFYTATYEEHEAHSLAEACGVSRILVKPSDPHLILQMVNELLGRGATSTAPVPAEEFEREHGRVLGNKLLQKVAELETVNARLTGLLDLSQHLARQRDSSFMLQGFCRAARELVGARCAALVVLGENDRAPRFFFSSGLSALGYVPNGSLRVEQGILGRILAEGRSHRLRDLDGRRDMLGLPPNHPPLQAFLGAPMRSATQSHGLIYFGDKVGAEEFSEEDERVALTLAAQLAVALENLQGYEEVQRHASRLEQEITERKQAEERIRQQAALLDKANDAILVRDLHDHILFWNLSAQRLYGWTAAEAIGRNANELLFKGPQPELQEAQQSVVTNGEWTGELHQVTREGKEIIVQSRWTLVRDDDGKAHSKLIVNTDITERKKLEAQFLRVQRMESIGTLAGGIAHDLNNVLTPITMAIELLKMQLPDARRQAILTELGTSAARGGEMVKQILLFARGVDGERVSLELKTVIDEIHKMARRTFPKNIESCTSVPKDLWPISGDATHVYQTLMNLCVNARDAMPRGGRLTISAENVVLDASYARMQPEAKPGRHVLIQVTDTGTGIPAELLAKIFDPFFTTKEPGKGTGLGLSTVLGLVKGHGGFVSVQSEVGKGSVFSLYFPALESTPTQAPQAPARELPSGNGELILVVDDEAAIREIAKNTLEAYRYNVLTANDGAEALAVYVQHRGAIQAVLTDMMMPTLDGPTMIRALQKLDPDVRVIAASGRRTIDKTIETAVPGVRAFLQKPYTADQLLTALHQVLAKSESAGGSVKASIS